MNRRTSCSSTTVHAFDGVRETKENLYLWPAEATVRHASSSPPYPRLVYLHALRHFCNAPTGNIVLLGIALGTRSWTSALYYVIPISAYALGAFISELIPDDVKHRFLSAETILVMVEIVFVAVLGALPASTPVRSLSGVHQLYRLHAIQHVPQLRGRADGHNVRHQPRPSARHVTCRKTPTAATVTRPTAAFLSGIFP